MIPRFHVTLRRVMVGMVGLMVIPGSSLRVRNFFLISIESSGKLTITHHKPTFSTSYGGFESDVPSDVKGVFEHGN